MIYGIIGAMDEEITYFQKHMAAWDQIELGGQTFFHGEWNGIETVIVKCGVGKVNAAMTTQKLIDKFNVTHLVFTGVAGACNPVYEVGDVVISTSCQQHDLDASTLGFPKGTIPMYDGPSEFRADVRLSETAFEAAGKVINDENSVYFGKVISGDQFIADKKEVEGLRSMFNADCVEMEGAAVAHVAEFNKRPYVVIRSISDKANGGAAADFQSFMATAAFTSASIVEKMLKTLMREV